MDIDMRLEIQQENIRRLSECIEYPERKLFYLFFVRRNWSSEQEATFMTLLNCMEKVLEYRLERFYFPAEEELKQFLKEAQNHEQLSREDFARILRWLNAEVHSNPVIKTNISKFSSYRDITYDNFIAFVKLIDGRDYDFESYFDEKYFDTLSRHNFAFNKVFAHLKKDYLEARV